MSWLASFGLYLIHLVYDLVLLVKSLQTYFSHTPQPLKAPRKQVPSHLALLLASGNDDHEREDFENAMLDNIEETVAWCRAVGVTRLTVYDRRGQLSGSSSSLRGRLVKEAEEECASESDLEYPLTPPLSDDAESSIETVDENVPVKLHVKTISLSPKPNQKKARGASRKVAYRRRPQREPSDDSQPPFVLHIISRDSGKPALASVATTLAQTARKSQSSPEDFRVTVKDIMAIMEGENGFSSPDLMIIHYVSLTGSPKEVMELHGFPPWQIRLTEYHFNLYSPANLWWNRLIKSQQSYIPLAEVEFRRAMDEFCQAEMRRGK